MTPPRHNSQQTPLLRSLAIVLLVAGTAVPVWARASSDPETVPRLAMSGQPAGSLAAKTTGWSSLRAALDDGVRPTLEDLPQLVSAIVDLKYEVLLVFDHEGEFLFYTEGKDHRVDIPRRQVAQLRGGTLLHNHPGGTPPSGIDYAALCRYGVRESIVAARDEGVIMQARIGLRGAGLQAALQGCQAGRQPSTTAPWSPIAFEPKPSWTAEPRNRLALAAYSLLGGLAVNRRARCGLGRPRALVMAWTLLAACTASGGRQPGVVFVEKPETASTSQIEFSSGPLSVSRASVVALCRSAEVTLRRGFRFMLIYDRTQLGAGQATWKLMLFRRPPPGLPMLDLDRPEWQGYPPAPGVIDADRLSVVCEASEREQAREES